MEKVSATHHLLRRGGTYYYRRRVPTHLVQAIGRKCIQVSLKTTNLKEARKRRAAQELEWDARFEAAGNDQGSMAHNSLSASQDHSRSDRDLAQLVCDHVERLDDRFRVQLLNDPPESEDQKKEMRIEAQIECQTIRDRDNLDAHRNVYSAGREILTAIGSSPDDASIPQVFWELVRRGLLELSRRSAARLNDDHQHAFFDQLFDPAAGTSVAFGQLADQFMHHTDEEAAVNRTGKKWIDKQRAIVALMREIIGDQTAVREIDHDTCLRVRSILAWMPANRVKIYGKLPLDQVIARAAAEHRNFLSPFTQDQYLSVLSDMLDLAAKKRLIPANPVPSGRWWKLKRVT